MRTHRFVIGMVATRAGAIRISACALRAMGAAVFVAGIAGCTLLPAPAEEPSLHVLNATPPPASGAERRPLSLEVAPVRAAPGCDTPAMVYVGKPYALEHFALNRWADTPARMINPLLVRALEESGAFQAVVPGPATITTDLRLDVELLRLQQDFVERPSRVELALRAQLLSVRERRALATRYIEVTEAARSDDPAGGVAAANAAVQRALAQVAAFATEVAAEVPVR
jgi:cholesterol transport system auxiliary component